MIETIPLFPGVTLRCCRDTRFKQECISFQILRPMCAEEAAMNALIPSVLLRGTRLHPDLRAITMRLDDLYGAAVSPSVRRLGDYQATGVYCAMMDERFALPGDRVLTPVIDFLKELLLDPPLENGGFLPEFVEGEKKNAISAIESERNDKRSYAMRHLLRQVCREDSFGLPRMGEVADVEAIDPVSLYQHYRRILRESPIDIFYVGSTPSDRLVPLLQPLFEDLPRDPKPMAPQTDLRCCPGSDEEEIMDVAQGQLCLGFTTPITLRTPEFAAMQLLNTVLGAGMTSKLFMNVREKLSLCYYVGSSYYGVKGIVLVSAGIDFDKRDQAYAEILRQLEACRAGDITPQELQAAREAVLSSLRSVHDSPAAIEGYYVSAAINGMNMTPQAYADAVGAVTVEDLAAAAAKLQLHSTYFLKGACQ